MPKPQLNVRENKKLSIGLISILITGILLFVYYLFGRYFPSTENAYVNANLISIAPKITGYVEKIYVKNNQFVKQGTLLLQIKATDFMLQLQQAEQTLNAARQQVLFAQQQIGIVKSNYTRARSNFNFSHQMAVRYNNLYKQKAGSLQNMQKYSNQDNQAKQLLEQATTELQQVETRYRIAQIKLRTATIGVRNAKVNYSYTRLFAPADGYVSNLNLHSGQLVMAGQKLFAFVDDTHWWIDTNMKETQLKRIKPGQNATIKLDMYSHDYPGKVQSISYASGSTFSLLPPENATGNWVKVIQYFTVRVALKNDPNYPLRVGASAHVSINTIKGG